MPVNLWIAEGFYGISKEEVIVVLNITLVLTILDGHLEGIRDEQQVMETVRRIYFI